MDQNQSPDLPQQILGPGIPSWGSGQTLRAAILAGAQGAPEGHNQPPLPVSPDTSLIDGMVQINYPSQAGRRA
jgi:hypothetical protein